MIIKHFRVLILTALFSGCAVTEGAEGPVTDASIADVHEPSLIEMQDDDRRATALSKVQSNPEYIMAGAICYENGQYILSITNEQADSLGIPASVYSKFQSYINELHEQ